MSRNTGRYITAAFTAIMTLGQAAHDEGWTEEYLDMAFTELLEEHAETPGGKAAANELKRWNREIRKFDRLSERYVQSQQRYHQRLLAPYEESEG